jgi:peptidoglycan hydrolase FlgJ
MAISPVSDIVLEVARAADPTRSRAAAARLGGLAGAAAPLPETFEEALGGVRAPAPMPLRMPFDPALALVQMRSNDALSADRAKPNERFEAFVLQTFIQSMLPRDSEALFGAGTAGEIWKSMLAEGLGAQLARTGGIGIARMLAEHDPQTDGAGGVRDSPVPTRS